MSLIPTMADIINVRIHTYNGDTSQAGVNDYGYVISAVPSIALPSWEDLAGGLDAEFGDLMRACIGESCRYSGVAVENVEPAPYPVTAGSVASAGPGTGGATIIPDQMCGLIRRRTATRGPSQRGRVFLPFIPTAFMNASGQLDRAAAGVAYFPLMEALFGSSAPGATDTGGVSITGSISGEIYLLSPSLIHRVPKPGVSTASVLNWVNLEPELGALKKRGDWGRMNREFAG